MSGPARRLAFGKWAVRPGAPEPPWADLPADTFEHLDVGAVRAAIAQRQAPEATAKAVGVRDAAVLVLLFSAGEALRVVLVQRSEHVGSHRGEVAFPGGVLDAGETPKAAALREAWEEIGVAADALEIVGQLRDFPATGSGFFITPVVAIMDFRPTYTVNQAEIESAFDVPLHALTRPGVYREEVWSADGFESVVPFFELDGRTIWGATATLLLDLLAALVDGGDWSTRTLPNFRPTLMPDADQRPAPRFSPPG